YFERVARGTAHHSATSLCVLAAGLPFRTLEDMARGEAVYWDITNHLFKRVHGHEIPTVSPAEAGRRLAALSARHELTLYESFLPDVMAHRGTPAEVQAALAVIDEFLGSVLAHRPAHVTLVLSSDHGHLESPGAGHTMNPVPLLVAGPGMAHFRQARAITDVTPGILALLGIAGTLINADKR
ncbi:MAG: peptidase, partial [Chloroflexi bacterium]|nr:peptidase [Chloroflexota bacterium]